MSPSESDDLTELIEERDGGFVALRSPHTAEHTPDYNEIGKFSTHAEAEAFLNATCEDWDMIA